MTGKIDELEKSFDQVEKQVKQKEDVILRVLEAKNKEAARTSKHTLIIILFLIFTILIETCGFIYYISNYGILETTEATQEGLYNFVDSEGNVISSDLSIDEMKELIKLNGEAESQKD